MSEGKNTVFERYYAQALAHPHKNIILYPQDAHYTTLTYGQITHQAIRLSAHLTSQGIHRDSNVALILENSFQWPAAFLGILHNGARVVPLNPALATEELFTYLEHAQVKCVITSSRHKERLSQFTDTRRISLIEIDSKTVSELLNSETMDPVPEPATANENDTALIVYTSGTTASPKGVQLSHKNLLSNIESISKLNLISGDDCLIAILPFYHSYPLMVTLILPLLIGAKISFPTSLDIQELIQCIQLTNVTIFPGVPQLFDLLAKTIKKKIAGSFFLTRFLLNFFLNFASGIRAHTPFNPAKFLLTDLHAYFGKQLRFMVSGGAPLNTQTARSLYRYGFTVLEGYGLTETSPIVSFNTLTERKLGSIGKPLPGVSVKIIDTGGDGIGEIAICGDNVTGGYYKNEEATKNALKDGWFYSGDLGYQDKDGFLHITGRKNELIVLPSGKKIVPEELETFYTQSPYIKELCVTLTKAGDKDTLTGVIIPNYSEFIHKDISQIQDRIRWEIEKLSRHLPAYQRIKKYIVTNKELPRTVLGKVKRYEVAKMHTGAEPLKKEPQQLSSQDQALLASPICQKALKYLETELKRPIHLDDHLELDLGLDSLEQVGLFMGFKQVTGAQPNELEFLTVFTVRDVLTKFNEASHEEITVDTTINWQKLFEEPFPDELKKPIILHFPFLLKLVCAGFYGFLKIVSFVFFRLETKGIENVPSYGPYLLCPNHTSFLDGPLLAASLPFKIAMNIYFVGYAGYFKHPLIRGLSRMLRLIPIEATSQLTESLKTCAYLLKQNKIVCFFPEGGRSISGELKPFKRGAGILVKELTTPVIPVYIDGAHKAWPPFHRFPRPKKVNIVFGIKQNVADLEQNRNVHIDSYQDIMDNLREVMQALKDNSTPAE
ncbi:MAG: AMP-binding protein [Candidatus Omnitrophica bacterium]|nr:AMP-binding protein [Candidatus Omnitrophota bacterium]